MNQSDTTARLVKMQQRPNLTDPVYLVIKPLGRQLREEAQRLRKMGRVNQIVIDIGCGIKPYMDFFLPLASGYWGIDINSGSADISGSSGKLPLRDAVADIVICTQVLEHCERPDIVLSEIRRILKPGGVALLSTHGVYIYHPAPGDYWRWTHEGLQLAARDAGLEPVRILPNGGPIACISYLFITMLTFFSYRNILLAPLRFCLAPFLNFTAEKVDGLFSGLYPKSKLLLVANYLVVLEKR